MITAPCKGRKFLEVWIELVRETVIELSLFERASVERTAAGFRIYEWDTMLEITLADVMVPEYDIVNYLLENYEGRTMECIERRYSQCLLPVF